jgi:integrase
MRSSSIAYSKHAFRYVRTCLTADLEHPSPAIKVEKALPSVKMLPGEKHRERVLTAEEEDLYFRAAGSEAMEQHVDPRLLADVARILLDCALRPEECCRLRPANIVQGKLVVHFGKSGNARRRIPRTSKPSSTCA